MRCESRTKGDAIVVIALQWGYVELGRPTHNSQNKQNTERLWIPRDLWRIRKNACNLCVDQGKSRSQAQRCLCYYRRILVDRCMGRFWWRHQLTVCCRVLGYVFNLERILILHNHRFGITRCDVGNLESPCQQSRVIELVWNTACYLMPREEGKYRVAVVAPGSEGRQ